ncbi:hypothetical protein NMQ14_16810 [Methyloversatilis sp. XJ19-13]|nr:hypothetical protein [Methyloversatilis sp. XJ19-13]
MLLMNSSGHNPFEPAPQPVVVPDVTAPESHGLPAGRGLEWLRQGWQCFLAAPGLWIVITVIWTVVLVALNVVPLFGTIAATLLAMVTLGGIMHGCRALSRGEPLELAHLWAGFGERVNPLLALGGWYLGAMLAVTLFVLLMSAIVAGLAGLAAFAALLVVSAATSLLLVIAVMLMAPVLMAMWFAPALVMFHRMTAIEAMRVSFYACLRNAPAFLVFALIYIVLVVLASIPAMLGWLVLLPVTFGAIYASYRDVFRQD